MSYYGSQYISGPPPHPGPLPMEPHMYSPRGTTTTTTTVIDNGMHKVDYALLNDTYYEEDYLYPPADNGAIAQIPPPKDTHYHVNEDPSLGGETWRVPAPRAPMSDFTTHCIKTPGSTDYERIIPWDHKKKDYVYGAVHDHIFRGRYCRRRLKRKIDYVKNQGSWDPVKGYNCCFLLCILVGAIFLVTWILFYIYKPYHIFPWYLNQWWWWLLIPFFVIMILVTYCCIVRASSNHATRNRYRYIKHACDDVNDRHLRGSGVEVRPGKLASWIEVEMDPGRTDIVGDVIPDRRVYHGEESRVANINEQVIRHEEYDHRSQIPIEGRPKRDYAPAEMRSVEEIYVDEVDPVMDYNTHVVEESVYRSGTSRPVGNTTVVEQTVLNSRAPVVANSRSFNNTSVINASNSSKKMSFYEKLKASKMGAEVRGSPRGGVNSPTRSPRNQPALTGAQGPGPMRVSSPPRSPGGSTIVGGGASSNKKLAFYDRLQKAKEMKERSKSPQR